MTRPPVVVVMGHVDHGKTTLLDYIRKSNVASKEAGAITQHIGAYQVEVKSLTSAKATKDKPKGKQKSKVKIKSNEEINKITFIDTPGHEAFAKMRARGANVADIAILVVAADDGVMPQTKEAIRFIKEADIPMIVAINKVDLPGVVIDKIKKQLGQNEVLLEGFGGDVVSVQISAKTGQGVNDLLEMISLVAEMKELKGNPNDALEAVIIESSLDKNRGPVASVIIKNGTLKIGDEIVADKVKGKIKAMINDKGERLKEITPGTPAEILGLDGVPIVGTTITRKGEEVAVSLQELPEENKQKQISSQEETAQLKIILKTDVLGTLEAITASIPTDDIVIIDSGTGEIGEADVLLARSTGAIIIGFNVKITPEATKLAQSEHVRYKTYDIIYKLIEEVSEVSEAILNPPEEETLGKAEIIAEFPFNKVKVAGCRVIEGRIASGDRIKVLRGESEVGKSKIKSLRFKKDSINKAELGTECGIIFDPLLDFNVGDIVISQRQ